MKKGLAKSNTERQANWVVLLNLWQIFLLLYPSTEDCFEELCQLGNANTYCNHCKSPGLKVTPGARWVVCCVCKKKNWRTARTFFAGIKNPRAWLGAIWLLEQGAKFNACELAKLSGIVPSSARSILIALGILIEQSMNIATMPSSSFLATVGKRSRETPAQKHPREEQFELEKKLGELAEKENERVREGKFEKDAYSHKAPPDDQHMRNALQGSAKSNQSEEILPSKELTWSQLLEEDLYSVLTDEPKGFDMLLSRFKGSVGELSATITMLELSGRLRALNGGLFVRAYGKGTSFNQTINERMNSESSLANLASSHVSLADCIDFVRFTFQSVSRKFLQVYIAIYSCYVDRGRWTNGYLLKLCQQAHQISRREILEYITPLQVKIPVITSIT